MTYPTTPKQSIAFPEVALIRKGNPKANNTVGKDLNDKFRVAFYPGVDQAIVDTFIRAYTDQPKRIKAFIPFPNVWDAYTSFNEAHNAGRMIAQADNDRYLMRRDPLTGQYTVRNGEPFTPFHPGEKITYTNAHNKNVELPMKVTNRLRLVIPEVVATGRLVTFTFKSTALYDRFNLEQQLGAIQALANTLNRGNAAGIPFWLYRAEREITWNKPDGSAARIKKWLVHLEPDPDWVKTMFERMNKFALTGSHAPSLPTHLPAPLDLPEEPGDDDDEDDDPNLFDGTARDVPPASSRPTPPSPSTQRPPARNPQPRTTPPARATMPSNGQTPMPAQASAASNAPLTKLQKLGQALWHDQWPKVQASILNNQNPASIPAEKLKKAIAFVEKRQKDLADFGILLTHVEKAWPVALSYLPLAYANLELATGQPPAPLALIEAVAKAMPELSIELTPEAGALVIATHYDVQPPA